jgi:hypothetical protein
MTITLAQPAYVSQAQFVSNTTHVVKFQTQTAVAGHKAIFGLHVAAGISGLTVSDNSTQGPGGPNNWIVDVLSVGGAAAFAIIRCDLTRDILTSDSITATWTTAGTSRGDLFELIGAVAGGPDKSLNTYGFTTVTALDTGSMAAVSVAGCFVYAGFTGVTTSTTFTAGNDGQGNNYTQGCSQNAANRVYGSEYILSEASALAFKATGTLGANNTGRGAIAAYAPTTNVAPVNTVAPAVTGNPQEGQTLTTTDGTWTGTPSPTFAYQWQKDGVDIGGATANTLVLPAGTATHGVKCNVTATNTAGSATASSNTVTPIGLRYTMGAVNLPIELCDNSVFDFQGQFAMGAFPLPIELADASHLTYAQGPTGNTSKLRRWKNQPTYDGWHHP